MDAIKVETTVDEAAANAIPALRPLLGKRVELIALTTDVSPDEAARTRLTFDTLLERRIDAPVGAPPLTDADIQRAIVAGALDGSV